MCFTKVEIVEIVMVCIQASKVPDLEAEIYELKAKLESLKLVEMNKEMYRCNTKDKDKDNTNIIYRFKQIFR